MCDTASSNMTAEQTIENAPVKKKDLLAEFCLLAADELQQLKADMSLHMSVALLSLCASHFRALKRAPSAQELAFLDQLYSDSANALFVHHALTSLQTEQATLAKEHAALVSELKDERGHTPTISLQKVLSAKAQEFPADPQDGSCLRWVSDLQANTLDLEGLHAVESLCIENVGARLVLATPAEQCAPAAPERTDIFSFLSLPCPEHVQESERVRFFFADGQCRSLIRRCVCLPSGALWPTLLRIREGCTVDLGALPTDQAQPFGLSQSGYLLLTNEKDTDSLCAVARAHGLHLIPFARRSEDRALTVLTDSDTRLSFPLSFLQMLAQPRHLSVSLCGAKTDAAATGTQSHPTLRIGNTVWEQSPLLPADKPLTLGDYTVIHCSLPLGDTLSADNVTLALAQGALHLCAAGGDFTTLTVAPAFSLGTSTAPCNAWAATLGLHRLVRTWNLTCLPPVFTTTQGESEVTLCLIARSIRPAKAHPLPPAQILRLYAVDKQEDGLPDLTMMRDMLHLTSRQLSEGHIWGLCPLYDRSPRDFIAAMPGTEPLSEAPGEALLDAPRFGLIVSADTSVTIGWPLCIHKIATEPDRETPNQWIANVPEHYSDVRRAAPRVLLPILSATEVPQSLIRRLQQLGAQPMPFAFAMTHQGCSSLAEAIDACDILLLAGDEAPLNAILAHRRVSHAIQALLSRDGMLIAAADACAAVAAQGLIGNGLSCPAFESVAPNPYPFGQPTAHQSKQTDHHLLGEQGLQDACLLPSRVAFCDTNEVLPYGMSILTTAKLGEREVIVRLCRGERILLCSDGIDNELLTRAVRYYQ